MTNTTKKIDATRIKWRVQWRENAKRKFRNAGLFETRERARQEAAYYREEIGHSGGNGYGFGNTRVIPHIVGGGK